MIIFVLALILISIVGYSIWLGISPMPSSFKARKAIASLLPDVTGQVYELGAGWGSLLGLLSRYPAVTAFELSPAPFAVAWLIASKPVKVVRADFFHQDLSDAGLIVCYLYPGAMGRLQEKFERELKDGCWVISNTFAVPGWTPEKVVVLDDWYRTKVYLYKKGLKAGA